jgi:PKD-like domain
MLKLTVILSCLICSLFARPVVTPTPDTIPCPVPTIHYPADVEPQKPFVLLVELNCTEEIIHRGRRLKIYDRKSLTYNWTLSAGDILEGQGTAQVKVAASNVNAEEITATVEVNGIGPECDNKASRHIKFGADSGAPEKSDKP